MHDFWLQTCTNLSLLNQGSIYHCVQSQALQNLYNVAQSSNLVYVAIPIHAILFEQLAPLIICFGYMCDSSDQLQLLYGKVRPTGLAYVSSICINWISSKWVIRMYD